MLGSDDDVAICHACNTAASDEDKCFGCGKYIHAKCDKNPDVAGRHRPEAHFVSVDED